MKILVLIGMLFLSSSAAAEDNVLVQPFIDGCYLTTKSESEFRSATKDQRQQSVMCVTAVKSAFDIANSAKRFSYWGHDVCMPATAKPTDVARHIVAMSIAKPGIFNTYSNLSDIVVVALVKLYKCDG